MTKHTQSRPTPGGASKKSWRSIVLECLVPFTGRTAPLDALYACVEQHPDAVARTKTNRHIRAKVRQTLQRLRDDGVVRTRGPGRWDVPRNLAERDA